MCVCVLSFDTGMFPVLKMCVCVCNVDSGTVPCGHMVFSPAHRGDCEGVSEGEERPQLSHAAVVLSEGMEGGGREQKKEMK